MKRIGPQKQGDFFYRIFRIMTMVVVTMTICCFGLLFYVRENMNRTKMQEQESYISIYADYMERLFQNVGNILTNVESNPETIKVLLPGYQWEYDYFKSQNNLSGSLRRFSAMSEEIREIYIYPFYHPELLYTVDGTTAPKVYYSNRFANAYEDWLASLRQSYNGLTVCLNEQDNVAVRKGSNNIAEPSRLYLMKSIKNGNRILGTLVVSLEDAIVEQLFHGQHFAHQRYIYIIDSEKRMVSGNTDTDYREIFSGADWDTLEAADTYIGSRGLYSCRKSELVNVQYLVFTPKDVVFSGESVFQVAYILLAVIFVMLLALTYNMSNRLYRPFRSIVDVLRDLQTPNETEEHELEKVRDKILDIVSLNHTLRSAIRDNSSVMLEAILLRLICAGPYAGEPFSSSDLYGIQFEEGRYNIFVVRMDLQFASEEQFYMKYYDAFCNILEQCLAECLVAQVSTRTDEYAVFPPGQMNMQCWFIAGMIRQNGLWIAFEAFMRSFSGRFPNRSFTSDAAAGRRIF